jgi:hypothetical protein
MMDQEEERIRAALDGAAPDVDETGVMESVVRKGRSLRKRRRLARGGTILLVAAVLALTGFGVSRLVQDLRALPRIASSPSQPAPGTSSPAAPVTSDTTGSAATTTTAQAATSIEYRNTEYGFSFSLPLSWEGFSIVTQQWESFPNHTNGTASGDTPVYGPEILIVHPLSTVEHPRQNIPIMVFTMAEWDQVLQAELTVGAAPIPPSELGRNATYVFALPARYNYAFPAGYEEVAKILEGNPLAGTETAAVMPTAEPQLSTTYEITEADNGKTFTYAVTSRFSVILDGNKHPPDDFTVAPSGVIGYISNVPSVDPPLQAVRYEGVIPGTCTIRNGDFAVTVRIVPLTQ